MKNDKNSKGSELANEHDSVRSGSDGTTTGVVKTVERNDDNLDRESSRVAIDSAYQTLLDQYIPPSLLIDASLRLLHVYGDLPFPHNFSETNTANHLSDCVEGAFCEAISECLQRAQHENTSVDHMRFALGGDDASTIDFRVTPIRPAGESRLSYFLVSIETTTRGRAEKSSPSPNETIETTNAELKLTNDTLRSDNEALHAVIAEYRSKLAERNALAIDESHLFASTDVGMVFVDKQLRVKKFTAAAAACFNLLPSDIGRPFGHITHQFVHADLSSILQAALDTETVTECELVTTDDVPFFAKTVPYRDSLNAVAGAVLSFVCIRAIKSATEVALEIAEASPVGFVGLDDSLKMTSANRTLLELLGYDLGTLVGASVDLLLAQTKDFEAVKSAVQSLSERYAPGQYPAALAVPMLHRSGRKINVEISLRTIETGDGGATVLFVTDMTERYEYLSALEAHRDTLEKEVLTRTSELAERNSEFEDLYENAPDMYASLDPATFEVTKCNDRLALITGFPKSSLIGIPVTQLFDEKSGKSMSAALRQLVASGSFDSREMIMRKSDGSTFQVLMNLDAVRDEKGVVVSFRATWTDVGDVYYLQKENTTFLLATEGADIGIWDWDLVTDQQTWSATFYELLGYQDANAPVLSFAEDVVHADDRENLTAHFERHFAGGERFAIEVRLATATGAYRWFHLQGRAVRDADGEAIRIVGSARDVHAAREAFDKLESQAALHEFITEETNDGWWDWDVASDYEYMSDRFWRNFGVDPRTKAPNPSEWQAIIHPEDLESTLANFEQHVKSKGDAPYFQEVRYKHADGHWATVICRGRVVDWDDDGKPLRMVGVHTDVTRLKGQESQLKAINEALKQSNAELERFAYIASHDLKAPLRGISNLIEFIEADLEPLLQHDAATKIQIESHFQRLHRQAGRMQAMIQGVLDYSRLDGIERKNESVDVRSVIADVALDHYLNIGVNLLLPSVLPVIQSDRLKLEQVFGNLISNAVKFHPEPEKLAIRITCEEEGAKYRFGVTDNGAGIEPRFHERIFDLFQTLNSRDQFESTGVGLTMVRRIVEQFGGTVDLRSAAGEGATFSFTWPKDSGERIAIN
ncbi:MAG: PAS domain-containing protein [Pseudomonadota bacterium]